MSYSFCFLRFYQGFFKFWFLKKQVFWSVFSWKSIFQNLDSRNFLETFFVICIGHGNIITHVGFFVKNHPTSHKQNFRKNIIFACCSEITPSCCRNFSKKIFFDSPVSKVDSTKFLGLKDKNSSRMNFLNIKTSCEKRVPV